MCRGSNREGSAQAIITINVGSDPGPSLPIGDYIIVQVRPPYLKKLSNHFKQAVLIIFLICNLSMFRSNLYCDSFFDIYLYFLVFLWSNFPVSFEDSIQNSFESRHILSMLLFFGNESS